MALDYKTEYQRYKHYFTYLKPLMRDPLTHAYFSALASIITLTIFIAFAIRPTFATIVTLNREISDKTSLSLQLDAKINALNNLTANYHAAEKFLPLVDLALPGDPEVASVLTSIEKIATISGVIIENVTVGKIDYQEIATSSAIITPVVLTLSGDYPKFQSFLSQLGQLPRLITVPAMDLTAKTANITINLYFYP